MFQCAWCKKENIDPNEWSEYKEPLCSECAGKYRYARNKGMLTGEVSKLTKEERRNISKEINSIEQFVSARRSVKREELTGRFIIFSRLAGWLLFLTMFVVYWFLEDHLENSFWEIVYFFAYAILAISLYKWFFGILQHVQVRRKAREAGFRDI